MKCKSDSGETDPEDWEPEDTELNIVDSTASMTIKYKANVMRWKHLQTFEALIQLLSSTWFLYMDFSDLEKIQKKNPGLEIQ